MLLPKKTSSDSEGYTSNEVLAESSSYYQPTPLDEFHSPYDIGDVHHFAHSLKMLLKDIINSKELNKNTQTLLKILCNLPVTFCTCKQSFSTVKK